MMKIELRTCIGQWLINIMANLLIMDTQAFLPGIVKVSVSVGTSGVQWLYIFSSNCLYHFIGIVWIRNASR